MLKDFRAFIAQGNVMSLAVGVIIGAAFATIVKSLTDDIIMPIVAALFGGLDFSSKFVMLGSVPQGYTGSTTDYAALKAAGVPLLGYGAFLTTLVNFAILAFIIFLLVRYTSRLIKEAATEPTEEVLLLRDIRDGLAQRR